MTLAADDRSLPNQDTTIADNRNSTRQQNDEMRKGAEGSPLRW
jgi:hypothetical protein